MRLLPPSARLPGALALLATLALGGCGLAPASDPFYIYPPSTPPRPAPPAKRPLVAVCTDGLQRSQAKVKQMIAAACEDPVFVREDHSGNCTILQPTRVTYSCRRVDRKAATITPPYLEFSLQPRFRPPSGQVDEVSPEDAPPPPVTPAKAPATSP